MPKEAREVARYSGRREEPSGRVWGLGELFSSLRYAASLAYPMSKLGPEAP